MGFVRQTWVKILIIVILVLVVGSSAEYLLEIRQNQPNTFLQPTPSSQTPPSTRFSPTIVQPSSKSSKQGDITAGWKTYTSQKFGYSLTYPPYWEIYIASSSADSQEPYLDEVTLHFHGPSERTFDYLLTDGITIYIWLFHNDENLPLSTWLQKHDIQEEITPHKSDWVTKQGVQGVRREEECVDCYGSVTYYFPLRNRILSFSMLVANSNDSVRKYYQSIAESVFNHFQLPHPIH